MTEETHADSKARREALQAEIAALHEKIARADTRLAGLQGPAAEEYARNRAADLRSLRWVVFGVAVIIVIVVAFAFFGAA